MSNRSLRKNNRGVSALEYALIAAVIAGVGAAGASFMGIETDRLLDRVANVVSGGGGGGVGGEETEPDSPSTFSGSITPATFDWYTSFLVSQALVTSGGTGPHALAVTAGSLPDGLSIIDGTISGQPTTAGSYAFTLTATDSSGATYDQAFAGSVSGGVFSTDVYTGSSWSRSITNGIDLADEGGLVWIKMRSASAPHILVDSINGFSEGSRALQSNLSNGLLTFNPPAVSGFTDTGFNLSSATYTNTSAMFGGRVGPQDYVSWSFRRSPGFFDVVTWTGTGSDQVVTHNLGTSPGLIMAKRLDTGSEWYVYHRSLPDASENWIRLNNTGTANGAVGQDLWGPPAASSFKADTYLDLSAPGGSYVAYVFAHDTSTDGVIQCGSYTGAGSASVDIDLGWESQWVLIKNITDTSADTIKNSWNIIDNIRGWTADGTANYLSANDADAENLMGTITPNVTGFSVSSPNTGDLGDTYIYCAIRAEGT